MLLSTTALAESPLVLSPRKSLHLPAKATSQIRVENGQIVRIKEHANSIQIIALKIGTSQVSIDQKQYEVVVVAKKAAFTYELLRNSLSLVGDAKELSVRAINSELYISGRLASIQAWEKISQLSEPLESFTWNVTASPETMAQIQEHINRRLTAAQLPGATLVSAPALQVLIPKELTPSLNRYVETLQPMGISVAIDAGLLFAPTLIELSVVIAEIKKGSLRRFGVQWPSEISAQLLPAPAWQSTEAGTLSIEALEVNGNGQVLAAPKILARSGEKASFMAGGEIPIRSGHIGGVTWKKHGVLLEFTGHVDAAKTLHLNIQTEVSTPDFSVAVNGLPGFNTNRLSTDFTLKSPRSILISGLFKKDSSKNLQGLPWLQKIPILGVLFSSRQFQDNESELVIQVDPKIIEN